MATSNLQDILGTTTPDIDLSFILDSPSFPPLSSVSSLEHVFSLPKTEEENEQPKALIKKEKVKTEVPITPVSSPAPSKCPPSSRSTTISKSNLGIAGRYKKLHSQVGFHQIYPSPLLPSLCPIKNENEESAGVTTTTSTTAVIQTNIPMLEEMERNEMFVIASRTHMFEVVTMLDRPEEYMAMIDVYYADTGEKVSCLSDRNRYCHILEDQNVARFEVCRKSTPSSTTASRTVVNKVKSEFEEYEAFICKEDDTNVEQLFTCRAEFHVRFRETNRLHIAQCPADERRKLRKKTYRKFCFRVSIYRLNQLDANDHPSMYKKCVYESVSFNVLERSKRNESAKAQRRREKRKMDSSDEENASKKLNSAASIDSSTISEEEQKLESYPDFGELDFGSFVDFDLELSIPFCGNDDL